MATSFCAVPVPPVCCSEQRNQLTGARASAAASALEPCPSSQPGTAPTPCFLAPQHQQPLRARGGGCQQRKSSLAGRAERRRRSSAGLGPLSHRRDDRHGLQHGSRRCRRACETTLVSPRPRAWEPLRGPQRGGVEGGALAAVGQAASAAASARLGSPHLPSPCALLSVLRRSSLPSSSSSPTSLALERARTPARSLHRPQSCSCTQP